MRSRLSTSLSWLGVVVAMLTVLGPLLWVLRVSTRTTSEYLSGPSSWGISWTLTNYVDAWTVGGLGHALINSTIVVIPGALVATLLATLAGWGLAKFVFPGRGVITAILLAAMFLPIAALVMPIFELGLDYGVVGNRWFLSVVYGAIFAPWATLFLRSYFINVPGEVLEAAEIDGAGPGRTFTSIAMPLALPAITTAFILNAFLQWNELLLALILLPSSDLTTVTIAIAQFSTQFRTGGPLTAAGLFIASLPIFILFLIGQRWLRAGALAGSVK